MQAVQTENGILRGALQKEKDDAAAKEAALVAEKEGLLAKMNEAAAQAVEARGKYEEEIKQLDEWVDAQSSQITRSCQERVAANQQIISLQGRLTALRQHKKKLMQLTMAMSRALGFTPREKEWEWEVGIGDEIRKRAAQLRRMREESGGGPPVFSESIQKLFAQTRVILTTEEGGHM
jgi:hypothetical protein